MDEEFVAVTDRVRGQVTPDAAERERLRAVAADLTERAEAAIAELPVDADVIQVGSTARGTWVAGDRDIDIFVRFSTAIGREDLEAYGVGVGKTVLPEGREEYAEHPYVTGTVEGFDVDLVPCYDVDAATEIRSAVDRTPFHNAYLEQRLGESLQGDVRLAKQFLKGIGAYGSDLKTRGFSGYLTELLVLEYGGFGPFVTAAADWSPPVKFDPEDHATVEFDDPLVVVDPTDPERNVAAVCSPENVARVQHYARALLGAPSESLFFPESPAPIDAAAVREHVDRRGTTPLAVVFEAPDVVADQLWPQLRKSLSGLTDELDRRGFDTLRAAAFAEERAVLFVELAVEERPRIERHDGPPVSVRGHATGFYEKYAESDAYGPFIEGDRYAVERERAFETAVGFVESEALFEVALGAHVETALQDGYDVLTGEAVATLATEFGTDLARYFDPKP